MLKKIFLLSVVCTGVFSSCTKDEVISSEPEVNPMHDYVQISAEIESIAPISRAEIGVDGKGRFVEGDRMTLLYGYEEKELTLTEGRWMPFLSWDELGNQSTFSAFFPSITPGSGNQFTHTVETNQSVPAKFEKSDLLFADPITVQKGNELKLNFRHLMSSVTVVLKGDAFTAEEFQSAKIQIKGYNKIQVNKDGSLGYLHDYRHGVGNVSEITFTHKEKNTFQAILCPQNIQEFSYGDWWLKIHLAGKDYKVVAPPLKLKDGTPFNSLLAGKNVTLTYSFSDSDPEFSNKVCWVYGLENMPDPSTDSWKVFYKNGSYERRHLPWNASYGWYDCSKKSTTDSSYDDMNLCWAATSSNMIHWWMDRNRQNIDRYFLLNPEKKSMIPQKYNNLHDSEIFYDYKKNFEDKGSFIDDGLEWFFLGVYNPSGESAHLINPKSGGYFKDVLKQSTLVKHVGIVDLEGLTVALKNAFKNKQSIGFSVLMKGFGSAHAMTIWGAKFDKRGVVCQIYYTDNNDGILGEEPVGLIAARVGEYEGTAYPEFVGRACLENSQGKTAIYIQNLDLLNLGTDEWNSYFKKHAN